MQRFTSISISISIKFFISNVYEYHNHEIKRVYRLQKVKHVQNGSTLLPHDKK